MNKYLSEVCKIGQGKACCRYIVAGAKGIECAKTTSLKPTIDARVESMVAQSDNCDGVTDLNERE